MRPTTTRQVEEYLASRRAMGFDLRGEGYQLHAFARFAKENGHAGPMTTSSLLQWIQSARKSGPVTAARRVEVLRPFLKYCRQFDPACPVLPLELCGPVIGELLRTSTQKRRSKLCSPPPANSNPMDYVRSPM